MWKQGSHHKANQRAMLSGCSSKHFRASALQTLVPGICQPRWLQRQVKLRPPCNVADQHMPESFIHPDQKLVPRAPGKKVTHVAGPTNDSHKCEPSQNQKHLNCNLRGFFVVSFLNTSHLRSLIQTAARMATTVLCDSTIPQ